MEEELKKLRQLHKELKHKQDTLLDYVNDDRFGDIEAEFNYLAERLKVVERKIQEVRYGCENREFVS